MRIGDLRFHAVVLLVVCLYVAPPGRAAQALSPVLPASAGEWLPGDGLLADVDVLQRTYTRLHPGLYRYATQAQVDARFDALRDELRDGASLAETYLALSRFTATVRCGHTYANFHNQSKAVQQALFAHGGRLPFHFRWLDGRMWVTAVGQDVPQLVPGTEVLRIDGVPTARILDAMRSVARADGANDAKRVAQMEVQGRERIEAFDVFLPLLFPQIGADPALVVRLPQASDDIVVQVRGHTQAQRDAMASVRERGSAGPAWELRMLRDDVAVLRMPDWALYDGAWDWRDALATTFDDLIRREVPVLVIDLRGNEGGLSVGDVILSRLAARPIALPYIRQLARYRKVPASLLPHLDTWDNSFRDWGKQARPFDREFHVLTRWQPDRAAVIAPVAPRYAGRVFVLVGPDNSSATFEFARDVQASGLATLIGQPTGGNQRGINGGAFFFLTLPHSGIEVDLPLVAQMPARPMPDSGLTPDILVRTSPEDLAQHRDVEMQAVIDVLSAGPKQ